jgi:hypothetical protein
VRKETVPFKPAVPPRVVSLRRALSPKADAGAGTGSNTKGEEGTDAAVKVDTAGGGEGSELTSRFPTVSKRAVGKKGVTTYASAGSADDCENVVVMKEAEDPMLSASSGSLSSPRNRRQVQAQNDATKAAPLKKVSIPSRIVPKDDRPLVWKKSKEGVETVTNSVNVIQGEREGQSKGETPAAGAATAAVLAPGSP